MELVGATVIFLTVKVQLTVNCKELMQSPIAQIIVLI